MKGLVRNDRRFIGTFNQITRERIATWSRPKYVLCYLLNKLEIEWIEV
jgi:hypothetical protein